MSSRDLCAVCPCGLFVIELLAVEAAVQDAYEAVAYGARGLVVGRAGGAALVVERPCAGLDERALRPIGRWRHRGGGCARDGPTRRFWPDATVSGEVLEVPA